MDRDAEVYQDERRDEWEYYERQAEFECDCMDAEFDMLEGTLKCWQCGRTEYVTGDRYKDLMAAEVAAHESHDQAMLEYEPTNGVP